MDAQFVAGATVLKAGVLGGHGAFWGGGGEGWVGRFGGFGIDMER